MEDGQGSAPQKDESEEQKLNRNFNELLQELRVAQTGVQILTGFLLTVPFSQRFTSLEAYQQRGYLALISGAVLATGLIIAPVGLHRALFRRGQRRWLVEAANWCAAAGLAVLAFTISGVVWLVFDVVLDRTAGIIAGLVALVFLAMLWGVLPLIRREKE